MADGTRLRVLDEAISQIKEVTLQHSQQLLLLKDSLQQQLSKLSVKIAALDGKYDQQLRQLSSQIDTQWLRYGFQVDGYSSGASEDYASVKKTQYLNELVLEGAIGGGLALRHQISTSDVEKEKLKTVTSILARNVKADSKEFRRLFLAISRDKPHFPTGSSTAPHDVEACSVGLSRWVSLRVQSVFILQHNDEASVEFVSLDGREVCRRAPEEARFKMGSQPRGKWTLVCAREGEEVVIVVGFDVTRWGSA